VKDILSELPDDAGVEDALDRQLGIRNIREILVGSYCVIYRIQEDDIHLLTVHHGAGIFDTTRIGAGD